MWPPSKPASAAIAALAALIWASGGLVFASLTPRPMVHHVFASTHIEHFAAFYIVSLLAVAALPLLRATQILMGVACAALVLETIRMFIPFHRVQAVEDLFCDVSGAAAVLAPMLVVALRAAFRKDAAQAERRGAASAGPWG
jgi:hypothetical protein